MSNQDIINAIHGLMREGKSITTASVKARLNGPVNMAQLLQLVSRYKQSPDSLPAADNPAPAAPETAGQQPELAARVAELEARVARLEQWLEQKR
ncbi:hypothetical protein C7H85_06010 [Zobellella endophytica]|uniref:KfrA N-terminal DNA-binding domain-containing protein n=1 Tax=Zobellella endophytica TaxID=2116700 RepID=A0A2P7R7L1_9GAMM|nr:hypothetical protein [Zobellella endophytica]PSJ46197.1 hypothetical protein C7H85_06010 [Zobellella endophytica]